MPLFSNPFDPAVEKATEGNDNEEDWVLILDICDRAKASQTAAKGCFKAIMKRVFNKNPHIVLQALTLLNACVKNSGLFFWSEVATKEFVADTRKLIRDEALGVNQRKISTQLKLQIKSWSKHEFKNDKTLSLIPSLYKSLKYEGVTFEQEAKNKRKQRRGTKDVNFVASQEEEDDIVKAIALSMNEEKNHQKPSTTLLYPITSPTYPTLSGGGRGEGGGSGGEVGREPQKVRALFDFEAVEDNELTFRSGEVIGVTDFSDENWWRGVSWRGEGLFPSNFVSFDLIEDKTKDFEEEREEVKEEEEFNNVVDESKINNTLHTLQNADPTSFATSDPVNMTLYEDHCRKMSPVINLQLEGIDRSHTNLIEINDKLHHSLNLYHSLMTSLPPTTTQQHSIPPSFYPPTYPSNYPPCQTIPNSFINSSTHPSINPTINFSSTIPPIYLPQNSHPTIDPSLILSMPIPPINTPTYTTSLPQNLTQSTQPPPQNIPQFTQPPPQNIPQFTQPPPQNLPQFTQPPPQNLPQFTQPPPQILPQNPPQSQDNVLNSPQQNSIINDNNNNNNDYSNMNYNNNINNYPYNTYQQQYSTQQRNYYNQQQQ